MRTWKVSGKEGHGVFGSIGGLVFAILLSLPAGAHELGEQGAPPADLVSSGRPAAERSACECARVEGSTGYFVGLHTHAEGHRIYHARGRVHAPHAVGALGSGYGPYYYGGAYPPVIVDTR